MGTFSCSTCRTDVQNIDRIEHFKSEWHIYNLKRVVVGLLPIPQTAFQQKKELVIQESETKPLKKTYCDICKKLFCNDKSYESHLDSKRHLNNMSCYRNPKPKAPIPKSSVDTPNSDRDDCLESQTSQFTALPLGSCLFCDRYFPTDETDSESANKVAHKVINHMFDAHNFSLPFPEHLVDPSGLLIELGKIVGEERACLACGQQFYGSRNPGPSDCRVSLAAVRNHMLDKPGHKRIWCGPDDPVELALIIAESQDSADAEEYPPAALAGGELFSKFYDKSVIATRFILPDVDDDVVEVQLPSGTVLGHRKLQNVYRQNLSSALTLASMEQTHQRQLGPGPNGSGALVASRPGPDTGRLLVCRDYRADRQQNQSKQQWQVATGLNANLTNRFHLRRQY